MLANLIQNIPGWETKTVDEITSALNSQSIKVEDHEPYTWAGVALLVGPVATETLRETLDAQGLGWVVYQLGGAGIRLNNPLVQQALLGFAQAGVLGASDLAAKGMHYVSPAMQHGLTVTPETVATALESLTLETTKSVMLQAGANRWNAFVDAIDVWDGSGSGPVL